MKAAEDRRTSVVRLYALLARYAPVGVVFRRGPSKRVLLVLWRTDTDEFLEGQWLKGRIYERRCDLSPTGERLVYFAANFCKPYYSWTAVSRPPYLTALALWPKGDCWGGGGLFRKENEVLLNHRPGETELAKGFSLPRGVKVSPLGGRPGWGEDSPIMDMRLERDGWRRTQEGVHTVQELTSPVWITFEPPEVWARKSPVAPRYELRAETHGFHERQGPQYVVEYAVYDLETKVEMRLGRTDWAEWCRSGDLLYAKDGRLFRLCLAGGELRQTEKARLLIDLSDRAFVGRESPESARVWGG